jgi:hypothetical protein
LPVVGVPSHLQRSFRWSTNSAVVSPPQSLPYFWRSWLYPLNPFSRLISASVSTALYNVPVVCDNAEYNLFSTSFLPIPLLKSTC